jgi:hypothetical protein
MESEKGETVGETAAQVMQMQAIPSASRPLSREGRRLPRCSLASFSDSSANSTSSVGIDRMRHDMRHGRRYAVWCSVEITPKGKGEGRRREEKEGEGRRRTKQKPLSSLPFSFQLISPPVSMYLNALFTSAALH